MPGHNDFSTNLGFICFISKKFVVAILGSTLANLERSSQEKESRESKGKEKHSGPFLNSKQV